jgi:hypothetical protein
MERLYRVMQLLGMVACWLNAAPSLLAKDYCSLKVRVVAPNGKQFSVDVTVYEQSGRKIEKEQVPPQDLQFCDLGILPVKVVVGTTGCHEIVVHDVRNYWQEPYTLTVTYDPEHCMRETVPPPKPLCEVLFRISGTAGAWLGKANLKFEKPSLQSLETDSAGRALLITGLDKNIQGTASAPGFISKRFSISCTESGDHEHVMSLSKK